MMVCFVAVNHAYIFYTTILRYMCIHVGKSCLMFCIPVHLIDHLSMHRPCNFPFSDARIAQVCLKPRHPLSLIDLPKTGTCHTTTLLFAILLSNSSRLAQATLELDIHVPWSTRPSRDLVEHWSAKTDHLAMMAPRLLLIH